MVFRSVWISAIPIFRMDCNITLVFKGVHFKPPLDSDVLFNQSDSFHLGFKGNNSFHLDLVPNFKDLKE